MPHRRLFTAAFVLMLSGHGSAAPPEAKAGAEIYSEAAYSAWKAAAEEEQKYVEESGAAPFILDDWITGTDENPFFDIEICELMLDQTINPRGDPGVAGLAMEVTRIAAALKAAGYLKETYEEPLRNYERAVLQLIARTPPLPDTSKWTADDPGPEEEQARVGAFHGAWGKLTRKAAKEIDAKRAKLQPRKTRVGADGGGCGAGEVAVLVRTDPPNGKVWYLKGFHFLHCRKTRPDAWNLRDCDWLEADPETPLALSGRYFYQIEWPDGRRRRGNRDLTAIIDNGNIFILTFRP